jgi:hypothetical protein
MTPRFSWALVFALIATLTTSVAMADARDHFRRGQAAYQQGNYDLAITEWLSGYQLEQRPEFQYNLAQAYERLGRLQDAVNSLQAFVGSADPDDASYSDATARLASLQQRLALTGVRVLGGQDGAAIFVDGRDWGRLPRPDKISVSPGSHQIVVRLAGFKDFVSSVVIPAGQVIDLEIAMEPGTADSIAPATLGTPTTQTTPGPVLVTTPGAQPLTTLPTDSASSQTSPWLYVGIGTGAVTVLSLIGFMDRSSKAKQCDEPANFCTEIDTVRTQKTLWGASTAVFGLATIGAFVLFAMDKGPSESTTASASCVPGLTGASCTVTF